MSVNLFEQASRRKLRFQTAVGILTTEDLWDLPLSAKNKVDLDGVARALHNRLKEHEDVSFVKSSTKPDGDLQLAFEVVKHVIDVRVTERDAAVQAAEKAAKKSKLLEVIARKQDMELENASVEELQKMVQEL